MYQFCNHWVEQFGSLEVVCSQVSKLHIYRQLPHQGWCPNTLLYISKCVFVIDTYISNVRSVEEKTMSLYNDLLDTPLSPSSLAEGCRKYNDIIKGLRDIGKWCHDPPQDMGV